MEIDVPVELLVKGLLAFQLPWANGKLNGGSQKRPGEKLHIVFSYIFLPKMSYLNSSWLKDKRKHKKQLNHFPPRISENVKWPDVQVHKLESKKISKFPDRFSFSA